MSDLKHLGKFIRTCREIVTEIDRLGAELPFYREGVASQILAELRANGIVSARSVDKIEHLLMFSEVLCYKLDLKQEKLDQELLSATRMLSLLRGKSLRPNAPQLVLRVRNLDANPASPRSASPLRLVSAAGR